MSALHHKKIIRKSNSTRIEDLKKCEKYANCTDEQCQEILDFFRTIATVTYEIWEKAQENPEEYREVFTEMGLSLPNTEV